MAARSVPIRAVGALRERAQPLAIAALAALAAYALLDGATAVWRHGWRDLFADAWRIYASYLTLGFPASVLALENGHRPVVPALLRVAELHAADGNHVLQWLAGLALAVATVVAAWWVLLRDRATDPLARAAAMLAVAVAVFWLGNARMLMHPLEAVQTYLVMLMLVAGAGFATRLVPAAAPSPRALAACAACAFVATFTFGTGLVVFPALAVALLAARVSARAIAILLAAMLAALAAYFALPGGGDVHAVLAFDPWANVQIAAQWLAAPVAVLAGGPLPDDAPRWRLAPRLVPFGAAPSAATWLGLAGMSGLALATGRRWRARDASATAMLGLALAWFALGAALLVGLGRTGYFSAHPEQVFAARYLPWGCLFWAGLALVALGARAEPGSRPWFVVVAVAGVATVALAQNGAYADWARHARAIARHHAIAVLADLWSTPRMQGESMGADVAAARALLRERRVALFAHPASALLGATIAVDTDAPVASAVVTRADAYRSDAGVAAIDFALALPPGPARARAPLWLVVDASHVVVGYAHPMPLDADDALAGVARVPAGGSALFVVPWHDGPGGAVRFTAMR